MKKINLSKVENISKNLKSAILIHKATHKKLLSYHTHNFYQILFLFQGKGILILDDKEFEITKNQLMYINPNIKHKFLPKSHDIILYVVEFSKHVFSKDAKNQKILYYLNALSPTKKIIPFDDITTHEIAILIKEMLYENNNKNKYYEYLVKVKLINILILLSRYLQKPMPIIISKNKKHNIYINTILEYIQTNYYKKISLDDITGQVLLDKRQLTRIFKKYTNMTIIEYLHKVRIENALKIFDSNNNKEIIYTCFESGFNDLSYFYRIFKKYTGITPREYLKQKEKDINFNPLKADT